MDWIDLAPNLVCGVELLVQGLSPGLALGDVYPNLPIFSRPWLLMVAPSLPLVAELSPVTAPPPSRTPSSGSGASCPIKPLPSSSRIQYVGVKPPARLKVPPPSCFPDLPILSVPSTSQQSAGQKALVLAMGDRPRDWWMVCSPLLLLFGA